MKQKKSLVSVVMTAYNAGEFVVEAVNSILNQTYLHLELIIVNDGSTDETKSLLLKLAEKDKRIRLVSYAKNRGASYASNLGLSKARGQFIARMDADDIAVPERLAKQVEFLQSHPKVVALGGQCELIDRQGNVIGMKNFPTTHMQVYDALYQYNPIQHPSLMINRALLGKCNLIYHQDVLLAHDLEILFALSTYGELANLSDVVLHYRIHQDSLSLHDPKMTFMHTLKVRERGIKKYGYRPSVKGRVVDFVQRIIIGLLPSMLIYPLFRIIRMRKVVEVKEMVRMGVEYAALILGVGSRIY